MKRLKMFICQTRKSIRVAIKLCRKEKGQPKNCMSCRFHSLAWISSVCCEAPIWQRGLPAGALSDSRLFESAIASHCIWIKFTRLQTNLVSLLQGSDREVAENVRQNYLLFHYCKPEKNALSKGLLFHSVSWNENKHEINTQLLWLIYWRYEFRKNQIVQHVCLNFWSYYWNKLKCIFITQSTLLTKFQKSLHF